MNIGSSITELRTAAGMSQQTLAERLFVSRELVSKWEIGARRPDYWTIERIAAVFDVSADRLVSREDMAFAELSECVPDGADLPGDRLAETVSTFLRELPTREADIFMKRYYFLRSAADVARDYGIAENHVRSILSKTRSKLKIFIREAAL